MIPILWYGDKFCFKLFYPQVDATTPLLKAASVQDDLPEEQEMHGFVEAIERQCSNIPKSFLFWMTKFSSSLFSDSGEIADANASDKKDKNKGRMFLMVQGQHDVLIRQVLFEVIFCGT